MNRVFDWKFNSRPDFDSLRKVIMKESGEGPVPIIEMFADPEIMSAVTGIDFPAARAVEIFSAAGDALDDQETMEMGIRLMDLTIEFSKTVGYDYVTMIPIVPLKQTQRSVSGDVDERRKIRTWMEEHSGVVTTRKEFEEYTWPSPEQISILTVDYAAGKIPPGMKVMVMVTGIFDDLMEFMGFETMAYKSLDEPGLVEDILEKLTILAERAVDMAAAHEATGAIFYSSDMGFNTGTILSPGFMRDHVIPKLKRIADACHKHGKPFILHSCGNVIDIMDDLIETVGIDAKHSFEDKILPVEEWYRRYGDRIAILGGMDMDILGRGATDDVRKRTREILEVCAPGGGYCMGTGNSVANYVRVENYYAMIDETRKWNRERGY